PVDGILQKNRLPKNRFGEEAFSRKVFQAVVWIVVIHRAWSHQLMLNEYRRRYLPLVQDIQADSNQIFAIAFRKIRDRADQPRVGLPQFQPSLGRGVLPHDGAVLRPSGFLKSPQGAESAGIVDGAHHLATGARSAQMPAYGFKASPQIPVAIKVSDAAVL